MLSTSPVFFFVFFLFFPNLCTVLNFLPVFVIVVYKCELRKSEQKQTPF